MLKHVQISPLRSRSDSISLRSTVSSSCASSLCGSPEPPSELQRTPSRASSYCSLNETLPQTTIKVFANCLRIDVEYKTLGIQWDTTSKQVIAQLLRRLKMRHRDPRLFYLSMEVTVRRANVRTVLVLDDEARPAILQACHPKGDSRFCLQLKPGGLIRVHTSALQSTSQYKSLVISQETTSDELLTILLSCYNCIEPVEQFSLYEVCPGQEYQRKLHPDDIPLKAQKERLQRGETCHFLVRRNPNYPRRRLLSSSSASPDVKTISNVNNNNNNTNNNNNNNNNTNNNNNNSNNNNININNNNIVPEINDKPNSNGNFSLVNQLHSQTTQKQSIEKVLKRTFSTTETTTYNLTSSSSPSSTSTQQQQQQENCLKCRNSFKSCDFCNKNLIALIPNQNLSDKKIQSYNPVYNIREIRTVNNSFSSLGNDKKFLDIELGSNNSIDNNSRSNSIIIQNKTNIKQQQQQQQQQSDQINDFNENTLTKSKTHNADEIVNNNPSKGLGHFIYI